jgi:ribosomal protein S18 acetylase RimI-like enzyme
MSDRECIIRPVRPEDARDLRENCFSANTLAEVEERIAQSLQAVEEGTQVLFVAEVGGVVAGTGAFVRNTHPLYAHRAEVTGLVVHPDYQRRGIARRIVEQIAETAASMGLEMLEIGVRGGTPAEEVYRRLGFVEWGHLPRGILEPWGEHKVYDLVHFYMPLRRFIHE